MNTALKTARQRAGLTAAALADLAGTKEMRVYSFERERHAPRRDEALSIAAALGAEPWELWPGMFGQGGGDQ